MSAARIGSTLVGAALVIAVVVFGVTANNFLLQAGTTLAMYVALAYAWNIVGGYMGYPSFGTAAFFGFGCYACAISQSFGAPMWLAWVIAGLAGAVFSGILGSILLGMRGHYFAIGTIAVLEVMREVSNNWEALTGGATGLNLPIMAGSPRAVGMFYFFAKVGLVGTSFGLMIGHTVVAAPYVVMTMMAVLRNYDTRLDLAAQSLGATPWQTLRHVTFPILAAGLLSSFLFAFATSFDELTIALFASGGLTSTLPKQFWDEVTLQISPVIAAVSTCLFVFVAALITLAEWLRRRGAAR